MSQLPTNKLTYQHILKDGDHKVIVFDSTGKPFVSNSSSTFEEAFDGVIRFIEFEIEKLLSEPNPKYLRQICKPAEKKGDGKIPYSKQLWEKITMSDWKNGHLGVVTQAELARIRGVSRQAVHQSALRGDTEIFIWKNEKYVPYDTIVFNPIMLDTYGPPMVLYFVSQQDKKKPRRR